MKTLVKTLPAESVKILVISTADEGSIDSPDRVLPVVPGELRIVEFAFKADDPLSAADWEVVEPVKELSCETVLPGGRTKVVEGVEHGGPEGEGPIMHVQADEISEVDEEQ